LPCEIRAVLLTKTATKEQKAMASNVKEISDSTFEAEVINSELPVVVDFWAPWCGPCKSIAPVLEQIASEYVGKVKFVKVNIDDNPESPTQYNVRGIPNLVFFKKGQVMEQIVGAVPKDQLVTAVDKLL